MTLAHWFWKSTECFIWSISDNSATKSLRDDCACNKDLQILYTCFLKITVRGFKERCFDESLFMFLPVPLPFPLHVLLHASPFKSRMTNPEKIACLTFKFHDHFSVKTRPAISKMCFRFCLSSFAHRCLAQPKSIHWVYNRLIQCLVLNTIW